MYVFIYLLCVAVVLMCWSELFYVIFVFVLFFFFKNIELFCILYMNLIYLPSATILFLNEFFIAYFVCYKFLLLFLLFAIDNCMHEFWKNYSSLYILVCMCVTA